MRSTDHKKRTSTRSFTTGSWVRPLVTLCSLLWTGHSFAQEWETSVTPYAWLPEVSLDTSIEEPTGGTTEFNDLLDMLDFAALVHVEAMKGNRGLLFDLMNIQLSDRANIGPVEADTDMSLSMIEAAAVFSSSSNSRRTDLILGIRTLLVDIEIELESAGPISVAQRTSVKESMVDLMIGVRHMLPISEKWSLTVRGDVASGDTDFSWNASAVLGRQVGESGTVQIGYRHLDMDFGDIDTMEPEVTLSGPVIGYSFTF